MTDKNASLSTPGGNFDYPVSTDRRPRGDRYPQALRPNGHVHLRSGLHFDRELRKRDHLYRRRKGHSLHRGYPIEQLAEKSTFMETAYLLLRGELPTKTELDEFTYTISRHTMVHEQLATFYRGFRRDAHPMAIMCGVVGALSSFYHDSTDITDPEQRMIASHRLIAKMPTHRRDGLQIHASASRSCIPRTASATPAISCA